MPSRAPLAAVALAASLAASPAGALDRYVAVKEVTGLPGAGDRPFQARLSGAIRAAALEELSGRFQVMMPDNIEQILRKSGKKGQEILAQCTEASCAAQFGQILGADLVVAGMLVEIDGILDLTIEVYDVATANVLGSASARAKARLELVDRVSAATATLLRRAVPASQRSTAAPMGGLPPPGGGEDVIVAFETSPGGARVQVDGQVLCEATPCRKRVPVGPHEVAFYRARHFDAKQHVVAARGTVVRATLAPRFGWVSVETVPPGAQVSIDGVDAGKTPISRREVEESAQIAVADPCWAPAHEKISVGAGEHREVKLPLRARVAFLKVNAEDEDGNAVEADVFADGVAVGAAGASLQVPVCARRLTVAIGASRVEQELKLEEGRLAMVTVRPPSRGLAASPPPVTAATARGPAAAPQLAATSRSAPPILASVLIPGGTAKLAGLTPNDPVSFERLAAFELDAVEVTVDAYARCVAAGACTAASANVEWPGLTDPERARWSGRCNAALPQRAHHPVNCVDALQAEAYCAWVGRRLPTEAELVWAGRGGHRKTTYPWGDEAPSDQLCWSGEGGRPGDRSSGTCPVGAYPRGDGPFGAKDLAGNVREWTSSRAPIAADSRGMGGSPGRIAVGGSWADIDPAAVFPTMRWVDVPARRDASIGFRCAGPR